MIWEVNHFSMIVYIGLQMLITSILLLQTYIFGLLLNNIILGDIAKITSSAFTYFILLILFFILSSTNRYLKKRIDANSSKHFNDIIANKLNSLPLSFIDSSEGRDLSDYADRCEVFVCDEIMTIILYHHPKNKLELLNSLTALNIPWGNSLTLNHYKLKTKFIFLIQIRKMFWRHALYFIFN